MLKVLRSIIQEVNAARGLAAVADIVVREVQQAMGTDVCSVYLFDEEHDRFVFTATQGLNKNLQGQMTLGPDEGLVGYVGQRAELVNLQDAATHPRYRHVAEVGEEPFHAFLGVPVIHQGNLLGVLVVQSTEARRFDADEEAFLITLSAQLSGVIANARVTEDEDFMAPTRRPARFAGAPGAPGIAIGRAVITAPPADFAAVPDHLRTERVDEELEDFDRALDATRQEIAELGAKLAERLQPQERALFDAYGHMLDDSALGGEVRELIGGGFLAQSALRRVIEQHVAKFESMDIPYLRERAVDIKDLGQRLLAHLLPDKAHHDDFPAETVLVAEELTPAMVAEVPPARLVGLVSLKGSGNAHVAILARAMGVPAVVGLVDLPLIMLDNQELVVDGFDGVVIARPSVEQLEQYRRVMHEEAEVAQGLDGLRKLPGETLDGHRVALWANTGLMSDAVRAVQQGAEGVGLYRTEVHFMMNERFPTEEEQLEIYRQHLSAFAGHPVTMRTLDIGGDKPLPYFPIVEENPFLGWRGIRFTLDHPEIFLAQVRAMMRAAEGVDDVQLRILLPMVASLGEVDEALRLIGQCHREVVEEGVQVAMPMVGAMIEVPAAVYQVDRIAERVDFLSVGSNDLVQYLLAVDRNNPRVADLYQEYHPSVLQALQRIAEAARARGLPLSICGEMAGHPSAAILLMAMGYDSLSMGASSLPVIKSVIRRFSLQRAQAVLAEALAMDSAAQIRDVLDRQLVEVGLGHLVRRQRIQGDI